MAVAVLLAWLQTVPAAPDVAVVCPREFRSALEPWVTHRTGQGHQLEFVSSQGSADQIRVRLRKLARTGSLRFIVLIGDADPAANKNAAIQARCVPTHKVPAKVNVRWGSEPELGTDNWYADLDDDWLPDVAIGRITADTETELEQVVAKTLAYERSPDMGHWRRQVNFVAGVGGFGVIADKLLETAAKRLITKGLPAGYETSMTYASWRSVYCPNPLDFQTETLNRLNNGCFAWIYMGHGHRDRLDSIHTPWGSAPVLELQNIGQLNNSQRVPIAIFFSCYAGAFDQETDCLAEEMLTHQGAPVAVICGSRVTMPYAMTVYGISLLDEIFGQQRPTLGEILLHSKQQLGTARDDEQRKLLDSLATSLSPNPDLRAERLEHVQLFNLLGDPLLRIHHPQTIVVQAPQQTETGKTIEVAGQVPLTGTLTVELACRRDRLKFVPASRRPRGSSTPDWQAMNTTYRRANDHVWTSETCHVQRGPFRIKITVPGEAQGPSHVRCYLAGPTAFAIGAADVYVRRAGERPSLAAQPNNKPAPR